MTDKILKQTTSENGYKRLGLSTYYPEETKIIRKIYLVHRLVALAFIDNPDPETKTTVNHIDGDKTNNRIENLEWATPSENTQHAISHGLMRYNPARGEASGKNVYPEESIRKACELLERGDLSNIEIAKRANISTQMVCEIKIGNTWRHISKDYDIKPISRKHPTDFSYYHDKIAELLREGSNYDDLMEFKPENVSKKAWRDMIYRLKVKLKKE